MKSADNRGINRPVDSVAGSGGYTLIKDSLVNQKGFTRYWDEKAKMLRGKRKQEQLLPQRHPMRDTSIQGVLRRIHLKTSQI